MMNDNIIVSVYCLAYNHGKYIRQTLEGFVNQKTSFKYEVIVHDDASPDNTAEIIKEYAKKYPNIIRPIFQTENQYSQGKIIVSNQIIPLVRGKYIAICEGDDFWSDENKLQKQVDALETHPECLFCVHKVNVIEEDGKSVGYSFPENDIETGIISSERFLNYCTDYSFQTSSYMLREEYWSPYHKNPPAYRVGAPVGDIPLQLYFGQLAPVYYINEVMSCYRRGVPTSNTVRQAKADTGKKVDFARRMRVMFEKYDEFTGRRFHSVCVNRISRYAATESILSCTAGNLIKNRELFHVFDIKRKAFLIFAAIFPQRGKEMYEKRLNDLSKKQGVI